MNSCPNCQYSNFTFSKIRSSSVRKPIRCKKCGEMIAKYNFAQPLLYSVAITAGSFAIIPILLWSVYSVVAILFAVLAVLLLAEYLEAGQMKLRRKYDLSTKTQFMLSFVMSLFGISVSLIVIFMGVRVL